MASKNLEISYLYRDAANYKQCVSVVVSNPQALTAEQVKAALLQHFAADQVWPDILHFRPEDLGWPTVFFDDHDEDGLQVVGALGAVVHLALVLDVGDDVVGR